MDRLREREEELVRVLLPVPREVLRGVAPPRVQERRGDQGFLLRLHVAVGECGVDQSVEFAREAVVVLGADLKAVAVRVQRAIRAALGASRRVVAVGEEEPGADRVARDRLEDRGHEARRAEVRDAADAARDPGGVQGGEGDLLRRRLVRFEFRERRGRRVVVVVVARAGRRAGRRDVAGDARTDRARAQDRAVERGGVRVGVARGAEELGAIGVREDEVRRLPRVRRDGRGRERHGAAEAHLRREDAGGEGEGQGWTRRSLARVASRNRARTMLDQGAPSGP